MKNILFTICLLYSGLLFSQETRPRNLSVPVSPAFQLMDLAPQLVDAPGNPKEFALDILQAFHSEAGWPQNYSIATTPYWWLKRKGRNVYDYLGFKTSGNEERKLQTSEQDIFSGLKFTSVSFAFMNTDATPDGTENNQQVFSAGLRTRIIRIYQHGHISRLKSKIQEWAHAGISLPVEEQIKLSGKSPAERNQILKDYANSVKDPLAGEIAVLAAEKPIFAWDFAAAFAAYSLNASGWEAGRSGVWTTLACSVPLNFETNEPSSCYINLLINARYLHDPFSFQKNGRFQSAGYFDLGSKAGMEINDVSFACELMYRLKTQPATEQEHRITGIIRYRLRENLYINGAFGKNFGDPGRNIGLLGINWGLGNEKIYLPQ